MKIYIAAFITLTLTSLASGKFSYIYSSQGTTTVNTIGNFAYITYPDGTTSTANTIGNYTYVND